MKLGGNTKPWCLLDKLDDACELPSDVLSVGFKGGDAGDFDGCDERALFTAAPTLLDAALILLYVTSVIPLAV